MFAANLILCAAVLTHTSAGEVHALPRWRTGEAVELDAVVTAAPRGRNSFVVADASGAVYVQASGAAAHPQIAVGDAIHISGVTKEARFAMSVGATNLVPIVGRPGPVLPNPPRVDANDLTTGQFDCQRVSLNGTVVATRAKGPADAPSERQILLKTMHGKILVFFHASVGQDELDHLVDCSVDVTGVVFPIMNARNEMVGARVSCAGLEDLTVVSEAPPTPYESSELDPAHIAPLTPQGAVLSRQVARGTVSARTEDGFYAVLRGDVPIRVRTALHDAPPVGATVEIAGYLTSERLLAELEYAVFRSIEPTEGLGVLPEPIEMTREEIFTGSWTGRGKHVDIDGRLVRVRGMVKQVGRDADGCRMVILDMDGYPVPAVAADDEVLEGLEPGYAVAVTGVAEMSFRGGYPALDNLEVTGFRLILRSTDDIAILRRPSWWTPARFMTVLGGLLALIGVILWRNRRLAQLVERRTAQLFTQRRQTLEFHTRTDERTRLAADLHDSLEQELTGTAMQLDAAIFALSRNAELAKGRLEMARGQLAETRADLHRTVWGLRDPLIREGRLVEALRRKYEAHDAGDVRLAISVADGFPVVPGNVAYHLFQAATEAVTNALKHAQAKTIEIRLGTEASRVIVDVRDDGVGFDVAKAPGPAEGHFGLQGMRERMTRLHGTCAIESKPGQTVFRFEVPLGEVKR